MKGCTQMESRYPIQLSYRFPNLRFTDARLKRKSYDSAAFTRTFERADSEFAPKTIRLSNHKTLQWLYALQHCFLNQKESER